MMNTELRKFSIQVIAAGIVILGLVFLFKALGWIFNPVLPVLAIVPFIMLVTIGFHSYLIYTAKKGDRMFISKFIASSGVKLMIYLVSILIYIFSSGENIRFVMIMILISYIVFSFIEIYAILKYLKK